MFEVSLGEAGTISVDTQALKDMPQVAEYIFNYGLKQMLNDVHASEKDPAAKVGLSQKKLDSLMKGEVAQARVGGGGDPVAREMASMAQEAVKAKLKSLGKKIGDYPKDALAAAYAKQLEANRDSYRKAAEAKLAIKPKAGTEVDLADLLGL